jgi:hypothetical protein
LDVQIIVAETLDQGLVEAHAQVSNDIGGQLRVGTAAEKTDFISVNCTLGHATNLSREVIAATLHQLNQDR